MKIPCTASSGLLLQVSGQHIPLSFCGFGFLVLHHDFQSTVIDLPGIDHERLTYRFQGRPFRLTDVHGRVVKEICF